MSPSCETLIGSARPVPRVIVGTANLGSILPDWLGGAAARERAFRYLDRLVEMGCSAFDTAAAYQLGGSERLLGSWMHSRRNRDELFLITKGAHPFPLISPPRVTPSAIAGDLHASLRRLRTDCVDLYLLHRDDPRQPLEPILETLTTLQQKGSIRAWGLSNWSHTRIRALDALARSAGLPSVAASSPHFSLVELVHTPWKGCLSIAGEANREARAYHNSSHLPVLAWSPLGHGFLSPRPSEVSAPPCCYSYDCAANFGRKRRAETLARKYRVTAAQIALAYLFSQSFPVFAVVAARQVEHMQSNLDATALRLPAAEVRWLESGEGYERG